MLHGVFSDSTATRNAPPVQTLLGAALPVRVDVGPSSGRIEALLAGTVKFSRRNFSLNVHQLLI